uniref:Uncharacterized protein n=1 Tax=Panagrolaimus sp. ES5 TaxID=591445 RepID=A0AC34G033_9BILA
MRLNMVVAFWLLATLFFGIYGENNDGLECAWHLFGHPTPLTQKPVRLEKDYYRINRGKEIFVGEEPFSFWLQTYQRDTISLEFLSIWNNRP